MKFTIATYWEKVVDTGKELRDVVKGQYVLKDSCTTESGWQSVDAFRKHAKTRPYFLGEIQPNTFKMDLGTQWGIHSYQLITFKEV